MYSMRTITGTVDIKRMDKYTDENRSDTLLVMAGVANNATRSSCLIFMKGAGSSWQSHVRLASSMSETFTDVIFTAKSIVAVSREQGENLKFYLRSAITEEVFDNQYYSDLNNRNEFNTGSMYIGSVPNTTPTWHYDNVQMRLCSIPELDEFCVAYESFFPNPTYGVTKNNISLYKMDATDANINMNRIDMLSAQFVNGDISDTGTFTDMSFLSYNNSTLLLHQTTSGTATSKSILQFASWSNIGTITNSVTPDISFKSVDVKDGRYVYASGIIPGSNDRVVRYYQDINYLNSINGACYDTMALNAYALTPNQISTISSQTLQWHAATSLLWGTAHTVNATSAFFMDNCLHAAWIIGN